MPVLFTNMHSPFPSSGNTGTNDGSPLSTRLGLDLMLGVNNLNYTYPWAGGVHSGAIVSNEVSPLLAENFGEDTDEEWFAAELPTVLPRDGVRFAFTLGVTVEPSGGTEDAVLESITLYLSDRTYNGDVDLVFDPTKVRSPYFTINVPVNVTVGTGDSEYVFIDHSAGTTGNWLPFGFYQKGDLVNATMILTTTGHMDELEPHVNIYFHDFHWWILPE